MAKDSKGHGSNAKGSGFQRGVTIGSGSTTRNFIHPHEHREFVKDMKAWAKEKGYSDKHIRYVTSGQSARDSQKSAPKRKK